MSRSLKKTLQLAETNAREISADLESQYPLKSDMWKLYAKHLARGLSRFTDEDFESERLNERLEVLISASFISCRDNRLNSIGEIDHMSWMENEVTMIDLMDQYNILRKYDYSYVYLRNGQFTRINDHEADKTVIR
jgi:hypothetical protein